MHLRKQIFSQYSIPHLSGWLCTSGCIQENKRHCVSYVRIALAKNQTYVAASTSTGKRVQRLQTRQCAPILIKEKVQKSRKDGVRCRKRRRRGTLSFSTPCVKQRTRPTCECRWFCTEETRAADESRCNGARSSEEYVGSKTTKRGHPPIDRQRGCREAIKAFNISYDPLKNFPRRQEKRQEATWRGGCKSCASPAAEGAEKTAS